MITTLPHKMITYPMLPGGKSDFFYNSLVNKRSDSIVNYYLRYELQKQKKWNKFRSLGWVVLFLTLALRQSIKLAPLCRTIFLQEPIFQCLERFITTKCSWDRLVGTIETKLTVGNSPSIEGYVNEVNIPEVFHRFRKNDPIWLFPLNFSYFVKQTKLLLLAGEQVVRLGCI